MGLPCWGDLTERNSFYCHLLRDSTLTPGLEMVFCLLNNMGALGVAGPCSRKTSAVSINLDFWKFEAKGKGQPCGSFSWKKHRDHICKAGFVPWGLQPLKIPSCLPSAKATAKRVVAINIDTEQHLISGENAPYLMGRNIPRREITGREKSAGMMT